MPEPSPEHAAGVHLHRRSDEADRDSGQPRLLTRWLMAPDPAGWTGIALSEWELHAAGFADRHPHDETNYLLEGELFVQVGETTVRLGPGDAARVEGGRVGRYWTPGHARMLAVYGPNPEGKPSVVVDYWHIDEPETGG